VTAPRYTYEFDLTVVDISAAVDSLGENLPSFLTCLEFALKSKLQSEKETFFMGKMRIRLN
jgi:hypothetical protein